MLRRIITNAAVQQIGKKIATDIVQSAAEDALANATGIQPSRTGAPSAGEALYTLGKGVMQHHQQIAALQARQTQQAEQAMLRQQKLIEDAQKAAMNRLRQERGVTGLWSGGKIK